MEPSPVGRRLFPGCRHISEFEKLNVIDEGTFGCVCMSCVRLWYALG